MQQNQSESIKGVLRGLHYQLNYVQGKLAWVSQGKVMDIALDIRKDSPTFGHYESIILDDESHKRFYIPEGFAHGYYVLSEKSDKSYIAKTQKSVGKWRSVWLNIPKGKHYYTFTLPNIDHNWDKSVFIRIKEWEEEQ